MDSGKLPLDPALWVSRTRWKSYPSSRGASNIRTGTPFLRLYLLALSQPVATATLFPLGHTASILSRENESDEPEGVAAVVHELPTAFFLNSCL